MPHRHRVSEARGRMRVDGDVGNFSLRQGVGTPHLQRRRSCLGLQAIQHPLAKCWAQLEANAGKYLAAETAFEACHTAMLTLGGMGYAQEYHVERLLREILIPRTAPVSPHMILNFIAEKVLELTKSY